MKRSIAVTNHRESERAQRRRWAKLSPAARLAIGAELHAFWVRNYFPDASRLLELCALFDANGVEYLVVGGQAVIAHGYPRLTKDLDLWVAPTRVNGARVLVALEAFGTPLPGFDATRFENSETMLSLGADPFRIDILTALPGVDFQEARSRRITVVLDGASLPLISKGDLIANKRAVGRLQDLADAEALEAIDDE